MISFLIYSLALFHGLIVIPSIIVGSIVLALSKKNLNRLENLFIVMGGGTVLSYLFTGGCFLTDWEFFLRSTADPEFSYDGGFVRFYFSKIGIDFPDIATTIVIGSFVILGTAAILKRKIKKGPLLRRNK